MYGPYDPANGHRFNHNKLLIDPYAKQLVGEFEMIAQALFGYTIGHPDDDLSFDERDSAPFVPKCKVIDPAHTRQRPAGAGTRDRTIIYETHLRGISMRHPSVGESVRGTCAGLMEDDVLRHIRQLGISSVELAAGPRFRQRPASAGKRHDELLGLQQHRVFRPRPTLPGQRQDRRVQGNGRAHLHEQKLEVILDVVYNHTAEGNERGPTLSMRGIDNASYYRR